MCDIKKGDGSQEEKGDGMKKATESEDRYMTLTKEQEKGALIVMGLDEEACNFMLDECELTHVQPDCLVYFCNGETIIVSSSDISFHGSGDVYNLGSGKTIVHGDGKVSLHCDSNAEVVCDCDAEVSDDKERELSITEENNNLLKELPDLLSSTGEALRKEGLPEGHVKAALLSICGVPVDAALLRHLDRIFV